jgi:hypothetical protein
VSGEGATPSSDASSRRQSSYTRNATILVHAQRLSPITERLVQADQPLVPRFTEWLQRDRSARRFDREGGLVVREPDINQAIERSNQDGMQARPLALDPITLLARKERGAER